MNVHVCVHAHTDAPSEGLINISQREEEADAWNLDTLFGHDGRREGPKPTGREREMQCLVKKEFLQLKIIDYTQILTVQQALLFMLALNSCDT